MGLVLLWNLPLPELGSSYTINLPCVLEPHIFHCLLLTFTNHLRAGFSFPKSPPFLPSLCDINPFSCTEDFSKIPTRVIPASLQQENQVIFCLSGSLMGISWLFSLKN